MNRSSVEALMEEGMESGRRPEHRGPDPEDAELFGPAAEPRLREATGDLCWLLDRGYALASATELVGNRYNLARRQRLAIGRSACPVDHRDHLRRTEAQPSDLRGQELWLDGFNVVLVLESAFGGGVVLIGTDGCCRDVAGVHRRYRKVAETRAALELVGRLTSAWGVTCCRWFLDSPIANSGRLRAFMLEMAGSNAWPWEVQLVLNPDRELAKTDQVIVTADRGILAHSRAWVNLARIAIATGVPHARVIDLSLNHS